MVSIDTVTVQIEVVGFHVHQVLDVTDEVFPGIVYIYIFLL